MGQASQKKKAERVNARKLPQTAVQTGEGELNLPSIPLTDDWSLVLTKGPDPERPVFNVVNTPTGVSVFKTTHLVAAVEAALDADGARILGRYQVPWGSRHEWLRRILNPLIVRPKWSRTLRGLMVKGAIQVATDLLKGALDRRHDATKAANKQTAFERMERMKREMNR